MKQFYQGKKVLVTGHTGFKGSWLCMWLTMMGAKVTGLSLPPEGELNHFSIISLKNYIDSHILDLRDERKVKEFFSTHSFDFVFHLAAQSLVLRSFKNPVDTYSTNVMGGVSLLEAVRTSDVKALLFVTTDKVYDNKEWPWGYRENDRLGGDDPYSASKAMSELLVHSYRSSFFQGKPLISTARAGNVIGGGDFSENRLLPDICQAVIEKKKITLRNPNSTRPWLYMLEPLYGYLLLLQKMVEGEVKEGGYNFGPKEHAGITTKQVIEKAIKCWGKGEYEISQEKALHKEKKVLQINWEKAAYDLKWSPKLTYEEAIYHTVEWYRYFEEHQNDAKKMYTYGEKTIQNYL